VSLSLDVHLQPTAQCNPHFFPCPFFIPCLIRIKSLYFSRVRTPPEVAREEARLADR